MANLRQNLLRSNLNSDAERPYDDSDDEWISVQSGAGTPGGNLSRPQSPSLGGTPRSRLARPSSHDPLRAFPTELSQQIFGRLAINDLAKCARVSKKWSKSQSINYVWFQHYRKENFQDDSLPPGKWTKRESKQNWRTTYMQSVSSRDNDLTYARPYRSSSGYSSAGSGYHTPKEANEERWKLEDEGAAKPNKVEMREMYKELGGRKSKAKTKLGRAGGGGARNVGGLGDEEVDGF